MRVLLGAGHRESDLPELRGSHRLATLSRANHGYNARVRRAAHRSFFVALGLVACGRFGSSGEPVLPSDAGLADAATTNADGAVKERSVTCNGAPCALPSSCCVVETDPGLGSFTATCGTQPCEGSNDVRASISCDEDSDCDPGQVCCVQVMGFELQSVGCSSSCPEARSGGNATLHRCSSNLQSLCRSGACDAIDALLGGNLHPDVPLFACRP